jgi:drug/metabolite transporter (DMT)-like permease
MTEAIAVIIAFAASFCENYSTYMQKKAMNALPRLSLRLSWTVLWTFFTNRPWLAAMVMEGVGVGFYMVALIFLPVSIVEPIITAGIALVAFLAIRKLGETPGRIDFLAIGTIVIGVTFLAVSLAEGLPKHNTYKPLELWASAALVLFLAVAVPLGLYLFRRENIAAGLGFSGGLVFGLSAVFSRLLMGDFGNLWYVWLLACVLTYPVGFGIFQAGLQRGRAVVVAPIYNGMMLCVPIVVGTVALNEHLPASATLTALRLAAFILIAGGAIVLSRSTAGEKPVQELSEEREPRIS